MANGISLKWDFIHPTLINVARVNKISPSSIMQKKGVSNIQYYYGFVLVDRDTTLEIFSDTHKLNALLLVHPYCVHNDMEYFIVALKDIRSYQSIMKYKIYAYTTKENQKKKINKIEESAILSS